MPMKKSGPYLEIEQCSDLCQMINTNMMHALHLAFKRVPEAKQITVQVIVDCDVTLYSTYQEVEKRPGFWKRTEFVFIDDRDCQGKIEGNIGGITIVTNTDADYHVDCPRPYP